MTAPRTRAQQLAMPLARDVVRDLAISHGGCIRPVQLRRTDTRTGQVEQVLVPCGHTLASVCPGCAQRARTLRAAQCREGWHLDTEPVITPDDPDDEQLIWIERRAEAQQHRDQADAAGHDTTEDDELTADLDEQITRSGLRGNVLPKRAELAAPLYPAPPGRPGPAAPSSRSEDDRQDLHQRGRQDVPAVDVPHADL